MIKAENETCHYAVRAPRLTSNETSSEFSEGTDTRAGLALHGHAGSQRLQTELSTKSVSAPESAFHLEYRACFDWPRASLLGRA
jgi:hypothetical protein